ncbi:MAG: DoxX family membrane protein [Armatimonadetes bacterium]|nr:DoxX family membrane protein [Armatimonadota bacterium]
MTTGGEPVGASKPETLPVLAPCYGLAILRLTLGTLFVWVFFENLGKGLYTPAGYQHLILDYVQRGLAPAIWKDVMRFMAGHTAVFAPLQAAAEISLGALLLAGAATRLVALAAFGFLASLWVSEWGTAWIWELLVPMLVALVLALSAAGRTWGVDARLARRFPHIPIW